MKEGGSPTKKGEETIKRKPRKRMVREASERAWTAGKKSGKKKTNS